MYTLVQDVESGGGCEDVAGVSVGTDYRGTLCTFNFAVKIKVL